VTVPEFPVPEFPLKAQARERDVDAEQLLAKLNAPVLRSMIKLGV
jgi:hypothetical protein